EGTVSDMDQSALDAYVIIVGSKQSVRTKEDGSYALLLDAGEYTAVADAYGYESKEQDISIEVDEIVQVDFNLEALDKFEVVGRIVEKVSNEPIEGAELHLMEDANIEIGSSD